MNKLACDICIHINTFKNKNNYIHIECLYLNLILLMCSFYNFITRGQKMTNHLSNSMKTSQTYIYKQSRNQKLFPSPCVNPCQELGPLQVVRLHPKHWFYPNSYPKCHPYTVIDLNTDLASVNGSNHSITTSQFISQIEFLIRGHSDLLHTTVKTQL